MAQRDINRPWHYMPQKLFSTVLLSMSYGRVATRMTNVWLMFSHSQPLMAQSTGISVYNVPRLLTQVVKVNGLIKYMVFPTPSRTQLP